jgi:hypothetical protein
VDDLERQLREFRPAGPPVALRGRVRDTVGKRRPRGWLEWMPAMAAAALIATLYTLSSAPTAATRAQALVHERIVHALSAQLGGDPFARVTAERLVRADENVDE